MLESVVVHVRLFEDLLLESTPATHVSGADFTPGRNWRPTPRDSARRLREARPLADQNPADLTWARVLDQHDDPGWRFEVLVTQDLLGLFRSWVEHVSDQGGVQDPVAVQLRHRWYRAWHHLHVDSRGSA